MVAKFVFQSTNSMTAYYCYLIVHLLTFALFTGTFVANMITLNQIWQYTEKDETIAKTLFTTTGKYARLMGISLAFIVTAGILMMTQMHKVYGGQIWLRIKIALVLILIILRIMSVRSSKRLENKLYGKSAISWPDIKNRITVFNLPQLFIIAAIIILSVMKFN